MKGSNPYRAATPLVDSRRRSGRLCRPNPILVVFALGWPAFALCMQLIEVFMRLTLHVDRVDMIRYVISSPVAHIVYIGFGSFLYVCAVVSECRRGYAWNIRYVLWLMATIGFVCMVIAIMNPP